MKTETAEYTAARKELATQPRQLLRFTNPSVYGSATEFPFSVDFVSQHDLVAPTKAQRPWIMDIGGNTQTVECELGRSSPGGFRIRLLDKDGEMVRYFSNVALTLNGAHNDTVLVITVNEDTTGYPKIGTIEILTGGVRERVRYTDKTLKTFIVPAGGRGVDGTTAASHSNGDGVSNGEWIRLGTRCQLLTGYAHLAEASWASIAKMEVVGRTGHKDRVSTVLQIADIQRQPSRATVFLTAKDALPRSLCGNPIDCALAVLISNGTFAAQTGTIAKTKASAAIVGTGTTFTSYTAGDILRCADGELLRILTITDNTNLTAAQNAILTGSTLAFRKGGTSGKYDVLDSVDALGLPSALIDVTTWEALRTSDFASDQYQFDIVQPHPGKQFIEEQFFKTLNCYPKINQTGQLSIVRYRVAVGVPTVTLDQTVIRAYDWMPADAQVLNRVHFRWDFNVPGAPGQYGAFVEYLAGTKTDFTSSLGIFGPKTPLVVEAMGWRSTLAASTMAASRAKQTTDRFAFPQTILALDCHYSQHHLEVGDQVYVNDARIPNIRTGGKGIVNEVFEVLDVTPSWRPYHVQFTLLWVAAIPTVPAPISQGIVTTQSPLVGYETLSLDAGIKLAGMAMRFSVVKGAGSPCSAYRLTTAIEFQQTFQFATGDQLEYAIWVHSGSIDSRCALDIVVIFHSSVCGTGGNDSTHVKLNTIASSVDGFYVDSYVRNATTAEMRRITAYVGSTRLATIAGTWTTNFVDATTNYEVYDSLRSAQLAVVDQNGVLMSPTTQLGTVATGRWYRRLATVPARWNGINFLQFGLGMDGITGNATAYIVEPRILTSGGGLRFNIFRHTYADLDRVWDFGAGNTPQSDQNVSSSANGLITGTLETG